MSGAKHKTEIKSNQLTGEGCHEALNERPNIIVSVVDEDRDGRGESSAVRRRRSFCDADENAKTLHWLRCPHEEAAEGEVREDRGTARGTAHCERTLVLVHLRLQHCHNFVVLAELVAQRFRQSRNDARCRGERKKRVKL